MRQEAIRPEMRAQREPGSTLKAIRKWAIDSKSSEIWLDKRGIVELLDDIDMRIREAVREALGDKAAPGWDADLAPGPVEEVVPPWEWATTDFVRKAIANSVSVFARQVANVVTNRIEPLEKTNPRFLLVQHWAERVEALERNDKARSASEEVAPQYELVASELASRLNVLEPRFEALESQVRRIPAIGLKEQVDRATNNIAGLFAQVEDLQRGIGTPQLSTRLADLEHTVRRLAARELRMDVTTQWVDKTTIAPGPSGHRVPLDEEDGIG